jgi:hypothetical protein
MDIHCGFISITICPLGGAVCNTIKSCAVALRLNAAFFACGSRVLADRFVCGFSALPRKNRTQLKG